MKINKKVLGKLEGVYATCITELNGELHYIVASEENDRCIAINANSLEETVIWDQPGGTMNVVSVPGRENEIIATQKFLPIYNSAESRIVHAKVDENNNWTVSPIMEIPFLHRFDLMNVEGDIYFIGASLCTSKQFQDDWSDPGKVFVGKLNEDLSQPFELKTIYDGITKNHGFHSTVWNDRKAYFITGVEGAFVFYIPENPLGEWEVEHLFHHEVSDCAVLDIDSDGKKEIVTIEEFHGDKAKIYKQNNDKWEVIYERDLEFGHVVWAGTILGEESFIIGGRQGKRELLIINYRDGKFVETLIDDTGGASNISVINLDNKDIILAANRQAGEYAIYEITI